MEVILTQDVDKIGKEGQVIKVKDGFARNFLLPQKMAFEASPSNLKKIEQQKKKRLIKFEEEKKKALDMAEQLSKVSCTVNVEVNDLDRLYGSIKETDVVKALSEEGYTFDKKDIVFDKTIEELGIFDIGIKLHPEVTAKVRLWVTKK